MHADTSPSVERIQLQFFRECPSWRKIQMVSELRKAMLLFLQSELVDRYPNATPDQIRRLMADRLLGTELATKAYGPCVDLDDKGSIS